MLIVRAVLCLVVTLLIADVTVIGLLVTLIRRNVVVKYAIWNSSTGITDEISAELGDLKIDINLDNANNQRDEHVGLHNITGILFEYPDSTSNLTATTLTPLESEPEPEPVSESDTIKPYHNYRLSREVIPSAYEIYLHPNLTTGLFSGKCAIDVKVKSATLFFIVHAGKTFNVTESLVWPLNGDGGMSDAVQQKSAFAYQDNEFWVLELVSPADPGLYRLQFTYEGAFVGDNGLVGMFRSEYINGITQKKNVFLATLFEPTFARYAFPSFDEPNMKSTFDVTIVHDKEFVALSNMPSKNNKSLKDGLVETKFMKSVPMSTYLVTFIVCDLKWKTIKTKDGTTLRVYATSDQIKNADYSLKAGRIVLDYYSEFFGIDYPLPKLDLVAIPDYSTAMENWGAISFSEIYLLFDTKESDVEAAYLALTTVAHETAHQWFGDIVTMNWWDDLWLNEGFADYMQYLAADAVEPTWNLAEDTVVTDLQSVMDLDAGPGSHPIIQTVHRPGEITEIFDEITYSKGCSVIRMLGSFLGQEDFRKGLTSYLKKYSYSNVESSDLWNELSKSSSKNLDVGAIMATWTEQMGFPVIKISRSSTDPKEFTIEQERFFLRPDNAKSINRSESKFQYVWQVPLTYRRLDESQEIIWLHETKKTIQVPWATDIIIKFNVDQTGFYKVNYDDESWENISQQLQDDHQYFSLLDRVSLLDDAMTLAMGGYLDYSVALNVTRYLVKETDYMPWYAVFKDLMAISNLLQNAERYQDFREYIFKLGTPLYTRLGWKDEGDYLNKKLRSLILELFCRHDHHACLTESQTLIKMRIDGKFLGPNLRKVVYMYGIASSEGAEIWDAIWKRYMEASSGSEKNLLLHGLAFAKQPWLINKLLRYTKNETLISTQSYFDVLLYIADNPVARGIMWDFFRNEYDYIVNRFTLDDSNIGQLLGAITRWFADEFRLQEMQDFFSKHPEAGASKRARQQALESVRTNIEWIKRQEGTLESLLKIVNQLQ